MPRFSAFLPTLDQRFRRTATMTIGMMATLFLAAGPTFSAPTADAAPSSDTAHAALQSTFKGRPITVGIRSNDPPFSYVDEHGQRVGFDVELAKSLCRHMKLNCRLEPMTKAALYQAAERGQGVDLFIAGLHALPSLRDSMVFSTPYYRTRHFFITNDEAIHDVNDVKPSALVIGILEGSAFERSVRADYGDQGARIAVFPTQRELFQALRARTVNVVLMAGLSGYAFLMDPASSAFEIAGCYPKVPVYLTESRIAARRELEPMMEEINALLLHLVSSGEFQDLSLKYFPFMNY